MKTTVLERATAELATIGAILAARTPTEKLCLGKNNKEREFLIFDVQNYTKTYQTIYPKTKNK